ncbi:EcsC family protein [Alicyclobacillus fastidiosus]|uniref:EcsC family protein n=1 Tax=Alicyclobacillus fastidiosus TaxID=392011 RepID=A0ABY6ZCR9_9BACL|nr:EcsC family protein [Alicyclobacillus fastidiosus]WAH40338.1 EcsC family protein [Alicyclobacillus fastidiosus]GMA61722.1 protease [Alicyclobacillus fastidiosus]
MMDGSHMSDEDRQLLAQAVELLECQTFADRATGWIGRPLDKAVRTIPQRYQRKLADVVHSAIGKAFDWVLLTVDSSKKPSKSRDLAHKLASAGIGAASGFAGGWAFLAELPVYTTVLLRTIADIARAEGEDLSDPAARVACIEVLALDAGAWGDHAGISQYYLLRRSVASAVAEGAMYAAKSAASASIGQTFAELGRDAYTHVAAQASKEVAAALATDVGTAATGLSTLSQLVSIVSRRFGVTVSEEFVAGMIPVIGALGGATINFAFTDHFQRLAHGHFTVRRLERVYGCDVVEAEYHRLRSGLSDLVCVPNRRMLR